MLAPNKTSSSTSWRLWPSTRGVAGLGIDIGQLHTKVVSATRDSGKKATQFLAATIPTGSLNSVATEEGPVPSNGRVHAAADKELNHFMSVKQSPTGSLGWSARQIQQLAEAIADVTACRRHTGNSTVRVAVSMAACDYRTLYAPADTRITSAFLQQSIAELTGDSRTRCVAMLPNTDSLATHNSKAQRKLRCMSLPEDIAWKVATELDKVGLTPAELEGLPWCMADALELVIRPEERTQVSMVLDWSFGAPTLISVRQGNIDYVRCLASGSIEELIAQAVADYSLSPVEATRWLAECLQTETPQQPSHAALECQEWVLTCVAKFASELNTAFEYVRWRNQETPIAALWILGGGTRMAGLLDILAAELTVPIRAWELPGEEFNLTADYAVAAALATQRGQHA